MTKERCCPMDEALLHPIDGMEVIPRYIARCEYCWPVFVDMGAFTYTEVHRCDYRKDLNCASLEEAQEKVAQMKGEKCPHCGKAGKIVATTDLDMYNEEQILRQLNRLAANAR